MSFDRLAIPESLIQEVITHARETLPNECCGLLVGRIADGVGIASKRFTIGNDAHSPTAYSTNHFDLFNAFRAMRAVDLDLLAVYHSHPGAEPVPSRRDVTENTYGETIVHIIIGLNGKLPSIRAWRLFDSDVREVEWNRLAEST